MKITSKIAATFAVIAFTSAAQAVVLPGIVGEVNFVGTAALNGPITTATGVSTWSGTASGGLPGVAAPISGDFLSIALNTPVTFAAPWIFANATPNLWQVGGFSFDIGSSMVVRGPTLPGSSFLAVSGTGFIKKAGFKDTPGTFSFTTQGPSGESTFSFSSTVKSVPDGGATLALLGVSFLGLGGVSRLVRRK
jgi:hypothetical protein